MVVTGAGLSNSKNLRRYVDEFVTPVTRAVECERGREGERGWGEDEREAADIGSAADTPTRRARGQACNSGAVTVAVGAWDDSADVIALTETQLRALVKRWPDQRLAR